VQKIPFNRPYVVEKAYAYLREAVAQGHLSGDGPFTRKCHAFLERLLSVPKVLLTTSCTHALEMAALLLDIRPGDEVLVPAFTSESTANAFVLRGARPVFVDVRPDALNIDEKQIEQWITPKTRAIVPVHYAGVGCEMDAIGRIAERHGLAIVEDNAHGLFGKYRGRNLGTFGSLGTLSFHETKNISCGEGGALLINDELMAERAEILREKGTDRSRFFRGEVDKYTWVDIGSSYLPSDALAALLLAQFERHQFIQNRRLHLWQNYAQELRDWAESQGARLPVVPPWCNQAYHLFYLLMSSVDDGQALIAHLREQGIHAIFHYQPLHLSEMGRRFGGREGDCPVAESVSDRLVRLPLFYDLKDADQKRIIEATRSFQVGQSAVRASDPVYAGRLRLAA
jgi:dTDP-4-amino-4,6-dideoxygalactose transaminase